jgi:hypothetical protein
MAWIRDILSGAGSTIPAYQQRGCAMPTQIGKRSHRTWQKLLQPVKLNARKRADCVVREARCAAKPGAVRAALEQAVAVEIERMRALHESEDAVRAFRAATEVHIALCDREAREHESSTLANDSPIALHGERVGPAQMPPRDAPN